MTLAGELTLTTEASPPAGAVPLHPEKVKKTQGEATMEMLDPTGTYMVLDVPAGTEPEAPAYVKDTDPPMLGRDREAGVEDGLLLDGTA